MSASGSIKAGRAFVEILLEQTKLERGLKQAQTKLRNFGTSVTSVGKNMVAISAAAAAPIAFATRTFAGFDDRMRMVKAVTGATGKEFEQLTAIAEKLGRETSFTARQVAEGMTALGRMGFKPKEIADAIPAVLNLARATGTELGEAAEIAANNMRVFGLRSTQMTGAVDILTATANGSAQTLTDLAEGLKMAGPQAAAAKDNIVNVSAALGVLANMGIRGSLAGTALRKAYSQFAKTKIQAKLREIGIATVDANGNLRAMPDIMADIAKAMNTMPTAERLNFAEEIFDLRGSLAGLQLGGNIQQLDDFIRRLKSVGGTAADTAREMDSGIGGAFRIFMSAIEGCQIAVGRIVGEALTPYINKMSVVLNRVAEWIASHKGLVITAVKVTAVVAAAGAAMLTAGAAIKLMSVAAGALTFVFGVLKVALFAPVAIVQGLMTSFALLKAVLIGVKVAAITAWTALCTPAAAAGAALAALVAVVWKLSGAWNICSEALKGVGTEFSKTFSGVKEIVGKTWEVIKVALASGDLAGAAKAGLAALKAVWFAGLFPLRKAWLELKTFLADSWTLAVYSILKLGNNLWYGLLYSMKSIGNVMCAAWSALWNRVILTFENTFLELEKAWIRTKGLFDSEAEVNAAVNVVETEYAGRRNAREAKANAAADRRSGERDVLQREWNSSDAAIETAMNEELIASQRAYSEALADAAGAVSAANDEWRDAVEAVRKNAAERASETEIRREKAESIAEGTRQAETRIADISAGGKAFGAWSSEELNALLGGGGNAQERTAKAAEASLQQQKETNRQLKRMAKSSTGNTLVYA